MKMVNRERSTPGGDETEEKVLWRFWTELQPSRGMPIAECARTEQVQEGVRGTSNSREVNLAAPGEQAKRRN